GGYSGGSDQIEKTRLIGGVSQIKCDAAFVGVVGREIQADIVQQWLLLTRSRTRRRFDQHNIGAEIGEIAPAHFTLAIGQIKNAQAGKWKGCVVDRSHKFSPQKSFRI